MAQIITNVSCYLDEAVQVHYINGNVFTQDNMANKINVVVYDTRDGSAANLSGTISASVIRADGTTVAVSGSYSGNVASITLPQAAYAIPGTISIVIKDTVSSTVTTIAAIVAIVYRSSTGTTVDPGTIIPSINTLIAQIDAAIASIPADYSSLWASLAPAFSASAVYNIGDYCTYDGALYRKIAGAAQAESWDASHWMAVNIGGDIVSVKSALGYASIAWETGNVADNGSLTNSTTRIRTADYIEIYKNAKIIISCHYSNGIGNVKVVKYTKSGNTYTKLGDNLNSGLIANNTSYVMTIPQHCYIKVCAYYRYEPTITDASMNALAGMIDIPNYNIITDFEHTIIDHEERITNNESDISDIYSILDDAAITENGDVNTSVGNNIRWIEKQFTVPSNYDRLTDKSYALNSNFDSDGNIESGSYTAFKQYIKVEPNTTYYVGNITYLGPLRGYDANKTVIANSLSYTGQKITTGAGVYFVRICVNSNATPENVTFQLGESATSAPLVFNGEVNGLSKADVTKFELSET